MINRKRFHRERAGPVRIDHGGRADAILAHQRTEAREQRRQLFGGRMRTREQRVLEHTPGRGIDRGRHLMHGRSRR